jgi:hypothetical protein
VAHENISRDTRTLLIGYAEVYSEMRSMAPFFLRFWLR